MLFGNLKRLIILGAIVKFASCEETDLKSSNATSRIRFVQYQPSESPKTEAPQAEIDKPASVVDEPEAKSSDAHVTRHLSRRQDQLSHNGDKEPSLVPKNYAFAYAIRDRNSGDDFSHTQAHNGKATKGQYRVKLPDGRVQIVTYTADNGGYRADIHYDKSNAIYDGQADNSFAYLHRAVDRPDAAAANKASVKAISPLLYFNEVRSFGVTTTGKPAASYETVEHIDESSQQSPKVVDDVNYLLKYVAPTIESRTENVFDITPDSLYKRQYQLSQQTRSNENVNNNDDDDNNSDNERLGRFKFELPADFPYRGPSLGGKKYSATSGSGESAFGDRQKVNFSQFGSQRPSIYRTSESPAPSTPSNRSPASARRPQILVPLRIQPQFVSAKYEPQDVSRYTNSKLESQEQFPYSNPKYDSRAPPQFTNPNAPPRFTTANAVLQQFSNPNSASLSTETESRPYNAPRYESQEQSPLGHPKYELQNLSQYESKETPAQNSREQSKYSKSTESSLLSRIPKYGPTESALLNIKNDARLFPQKSGELSNAPQRYTPKSELRDQIQQTPKYDSRAPPLYVTTPRYQTEKDSSSQISGGSDGGKYETAQGLPELVLKFENREQSPFETPKIDPQKFRPSQPFVPRNPDRPLFAPYNLYGSELDASQPTTPKYQHVEEMNYESGPVDGNSIESPKPKYTSQETLPPNRNSQEHHPTIAGPLSRYNPKDASISSGVFPYTSEELHPSTPTVPVYVANTDPGRPTAQFGKIEIPQYLHIHQYDSGEDAKSREIVYYTPLQIPIPNSVAYMERGNITDVNSNPYASLTPSYVTMTEHPHSAPGDQSSQYPESVSLYDQSRFELPSNLTNLYTNHEAPADQPETESPDYRHPHHQINDLRFASRPTYKDVSFNSRPLQPPAQRPQAPPPPPPSPHVTTESSAEEQPYREPERGNDMAMRYFDPRTFSGYFDFLSSPELQEEKPSPEGGREPEQNQQQELNPPPQPPSPPSPPPQSASQQPNRPQIPQYRPGYATATPAYRYKGAEGGGREGNAPFGSDPLRNTSFRASAYLRPLHKERVYIHHNSQPTTPTDDHFSGIASTTRMHKKTADISIVKSISSTIPPELLKDFDYQLSASVFQDAVHEGSEASSSKSVPPVHPKLDKSIVKKLQNALSTNGKIYFKSPSTQQERTVS